MDKILDEIHGTNVDFTQDARNNVTIPLSDLVLLRIQ